MLDKSRGLNVDCVAYDLEDSVTSDKKPVARKAIRGFLDQPRTKGIGENAVRINAVESGQALDDLTEILKAPNLDTIVVPKVNSAADLHFVTDVIKHTLPSRHPTAPNSDSREQQPIGVLALIESAKGLLNLPSICQSSPYLSGLIFAAEDFALDLSITRTPSLTEFLYARSAIITACRAYNLPSAIDLVCTSYKGEEGLQTLERECLEGRRLGFNGKQLIHPGQVDIAQGAFAPGYDEITWAIRVVIADEKADRQGRGAWTLDGKMIDVPVVRKAKNIIIKAELCGCDVAAAKEKWKDQDPE
ncbi:MAG: hypothetical protein Q9191_001456 [Dirinaria sp. TL-2023a]